jgi:hypothetical protein
MSIDYYRYVGPVVVCKTPVETVEEPDGRVCVAQPERHGRHETAKFCPDCGAETKVRTKPRKRTRDPLDNWSDHGFDLICERPDGWPKDEHLYVVNLVNDATRRPFRVEDEEHREFVSAADIQADVKWLSERCAVSIAKLVAVYGEENVRLDWGVFTWWN